MFSKPFRVKSNSQLKGSERKKLYEELGKAFPNLTEEDIQNILPKKEALNVIKIVTHNGQLCRLYCIARVPMFFQLDSSVPGFFPTVYTLWHHPNLLYSYTTHSSVIPKLAAGADLMLPGVVLNGPPTLYSYGKIARGAPVSVNTEDNKASIAVGVTTLTSEDMYMSGGHGKCVQIFHVLGDSLCQFGKSVTRPDLGSPFESNGENVSSEESSKASNDELAETTCSRLNRIDINNEVNADKTSEAEVEDKSEDIQQDETKIVSPVQIEVVDPIQEMDNLLEYCFLKACKTTIKRSDMPMLTSNFFKNHLLAACPPGRNVDIKKTSYKKLSVFLASMSSKGIIHTTVIKGVESILSIKANHPLLKKLVIKEEIPIPPPVVSNAPIISECYKVTTDVFPILSKYGFEKGDTLKRAEARRYFTEYVKEENLQNGKILKLNPRLAGMFRTKEHQETLTMEDAINKFIGRMARTFEITVAGVTVLRAGKVDPIDITVASRSGNKKVTLVNNLETFGIKLDEFSKECQGIGASATITDVPGKKTPSVLVQGNQVLYVYKLLTEKYQMHHSYIRGLEYAPKQKK
ncbi:eukaryotic translation initiation factor 2D [Orussus abietinus]|uniref:eukaryotic translation initiation factor 2D n=1 Tax=Orussus abietinus TaxID=222816 RepID=UPI0006263AA1|nr:eukaryotic translation initiation factor 2D [Orussus abietinus]